MSTAYLALSDEDRRFLHDRMDALTAAVEVGDHDRAGRALRELVAESADPGVVKVVLAEIAARGARTSD